MKEIGLHRAALAEAQAAYDWYAVRDPAAAEAFIEEFDHAIEQIGKFPEAGASYVSATRRYVMRRFPFTLVYREQDSNRGRRAWSSEAGLLEKESQNREPHGPDQLTPRCSR
jgi:plasmid stabilization system protein ParE